MAEYDDKLGFILSPEDIAINKNRLETIENAVKAIEKAIKCFDPEFDKELLETLNSAMDILYYNAMGLDATISDHSPKIKTETYVVDMEKDETIKVVCEMPASLVGIINPHVCSTAVSDAVSKHNKSKMRKIEFLPEENETEENESL